MASILNDIIILLILILINGAFAMAEMAVISARKAKLRVMADQGNIKAEKALELSEKPGNFLSTIQIGITLIGILSGAYGGAIIAEDLSPYLNAYPLLAPYAKIISLSLVVVVTTYLSLVLGELIPKRLALQNPERVASAVSIPIHYLSLLTFPVVRLLSISSESIIRMMGLKQPVSTVSEEEVKVLLEEGTEAGVFHKMEQDIIHGAFRIDDLSVRNVMTPRPDIMWLDYERPFKENLEIIKTSDHAYFPVCEGDLDHVIGFLHVKDLFKIYPDFDGSDIKPLLRKPFIFPETISALRVLEHFKASPIHVALIVDEYGTIQGLVTVNDIMAAIVGDIPSFNESEEKAIVEREDGSWLIDGTLSIDEFTEHFRIEALPDEEDAEYHTLAGFIMTYLGRIPITGDHFRWEQYRFEILDMDGNRIDKVLMSRLPDADSKE
jgi:putative hemolysin